jgi:hypothetical protein
MFTLDRSIGGRPRRWVRQRARAAVAVIIAPLALVAAVPAAAQSNDSDLRNEVGELHRTVEGLNAKIQDLERRIADHPQPAQPAPESAAGPPAADANVSAAANKHDPGERWHEIRRGLSKAEVEAAIGRPSRIMDVSPRTVWYYQYASVGNGSVVFAADDTVIDWQTPPFGTWW